MSDSTTSAILTASMVVEVDDARSRDDDDSDFVRHLDDLVEELVLDDKFYGGGSSEIDYTQPLIPKPDGDRPSSAFKVVDNIADDDDVEDENNGIPDLIFNEPRKPLKAVDDDSFDFRLKMGFTDKEPAEADDAFADDAAAELPAATAKVTKPPKRVVRPRRE